MQKQKFLPKAIIFVYSKKHVKMANFNLLTFCHYFLNTKYVKTYKFYNLERHWI